MVNTPDQQDSGTTPDFSTDVAWEEWGRQDPYFGVITSPKYRRSEITEESRRLFFESGQHTVADFMREIRQHLVPDFSPKTVLDFGCGVGRVSIPFAAIVDQVVAMDVSEAMLIEARKNCLQHNVLNVRFALSNDQLDSVTEKFDLVYSVMVFQHIPTERGKWIFRRLLDKIAPGGVGAIHVLYSKTVYASTLGLKPPEPTPKWHQRFRLKAVPRTLQMQMNPYNLNELMFFIQGQGVQQVHIRFTDHGGELGVLLYFQAAVAPGN